jgi:hypothetical protein
VTTARISEVYVMKRKPAFVTSEVARSLCSCLAATHLLQCNAVLSV